MTPSLGDNAAQVASTTVSALKETPAILCVVIFNVIFMLMVGYLSVRAGSRADNELERMHGLVAKTLAACTTKS